jgi:hypothetical protein
MKTYITALVLVFGLATVTSMIALTVHGATTTLTGAATRAGHQKMAFLY